MEKAFLRQAYLKRESGHACIAQTTILQRSYLPLLRKQKEANVSIETHFTGINAFVIIVPVL